MRSGRSSRYWGRGFYKHSTSNEVKNSVAALRRNSEQALTSISGSAFRLPQASSLRRFCHQLIETLESRLFPLCTDDPPVHYLTIRGRLRLEELPCCFISFQLSQIRLDQIRTSLFVRINAGAIFFAIFIGFDPGWLHTIFIEQSFDVPDVHRAPNAGRLPRRETNPIAVFIDILAQAINPTKRELLVDRFRPGYARFA